MKSAGGIERIRQARASISRAGRVLVMPKPEAVARLAPELERAIGCVAALQQDVRAGGPVDRRQALGSLQELEAELERLRGLLEYAAAWHTAWGRLLATVASDVPEATNHKISVRA